MGTRLSLKPVTLVHLRAVKERDNTVQGLELRAEYCDFMSRTASTPIGAGLWDHSAELRRKEAQRLRNLETMEV